LRIDFEYESLQTFYGVNLRHYEKGTRVFQESSGAVGSVYMSTKHRFSGFTCDNSNCITFKYKSFQKYHFDYSNWAESSCAPGTDAYSYQGSWLMKGLNLTQGADCSIVASWFVCFVLNIRFYSLL
jgi:hypothetical protein